MTIFDESWSGRLRLVGELERPDHYYLNADDSCYFFGEYTAREGYSHSSTNQLIHNLKKKPELAVTAPAQYAWKVRAINDIATALRANLTILPGLTVVPIPPSKCPGEVGFDDRMARVARAIAPALDVREALVTAVERNAMHLTQNHRDPDALRESLALVAGQLGNPPQHVILLDDVLTTGCSFMVCRSKLREAWPNAAYYGIFVARRILPPAFADFDLNDLI